MIDSSICPRCDSLHILRITGDDEPTKHYGRLICGDCGKFITWLRDPSVSLNHLHRKETIDNALATSDLNQWERDFLKSIYEKRTLSPRQLSTYQRIYQKITPNRVSGRGERAIADSC